MKRSAPLRRKTPLKRSQKPLKRSAIKKPTVADLIASGKVKYGSTVKRSAKPIRKRAKNNPGWVGLAKKMWGQDESLHYCEVSGTYLGEDFSPTFVHHILHRGSYRKFARRPDNFAWVSLDTHTKAHEFGIEQMAEEGTENAKGWHNLNMRLHALRAEAHGLREGCAAADEGGVPELKAKDRSVAECGTSPVRGNEDAPKRR